jgi:hypothetical protein
MSTGMLCAVERNMAGIECDGGAGGRTLYMASHVKDRRSAIKLRSLKIGSPLPNRRFSASKIPHECG